MQFFWFVSGRSAFSCGDQLVFSTGHWLRCHHFYQSSLKGHPLQERFSFLICALPLRCIQACIMCGGRRGLDLVQRLHERGDNCRNGMLEPTDPAFAGSVGSTMSDLYTTFDTDIAKSLSWTTKPWCFRKEEIEKSWTKMWQLHSIFIGSLELSPTCNIMWRIKYMNKQYLM